MNPNIEKTILWEPCDKSYENVILTNISPIRDGILEKSEIINESRWFYESYEIAVNWKIYRLLKISPWNIVIDVLKTIWSHCKNLYLIGLAWSLNASFGIWDIICPKLVSKIWDMENVLEIWAKIGWTWKICQVDWLVHENDFYETLLADGIDFVDMESWEIAYYANEFWFKANTVSMISDLPLRIPFYAADKPEKIDFDKIINLL